MFICEGTVKDFKSKFSLAIDVEVLTGDRNTELPNGVARNIACSSRMSDARDCFVRFMEGFGTEVDGIVV